MVCKICEKGFLKKMYWLLMVPIFNIRCLTKLFVKKEKPFHETEHSKTCKDITIGLKFLVPYAWK